MCKSRVSAVAFQRPTNCKAQSIRYLIKNKEARVAIKITPNSQTILWDTRLQVSTQLAIPQLGPV